tara:strand:+ start:96 stop:650 length:555 start_codon:yes stop_codon:yes gene_type:complete
MFFGLIKIKQRVMEFEQNSRIFFKLSKAKGDISNLALKLENKSLISNEKLRNLFLFYWTAARVKIYLSIVDQYQLYHPKNIDEKTYTNEDGYLRSSLEKHLLRYVSYDINPDFDTQTDEGHGIEKYFRLFNEDKSREYSNTINEECFKNELSENDLKLLDKFFDTARNTFNGVIKNTKITFNND